MVSSSPSVYQSPLTKFLVVLFVLAIAAASAIPSYFSGQWVWNRVPELGNVKPLQALQADGLTLPEWQTLDQQTMEVGGHQWSVQTIVPDRQADTAIPLYSAILMLRPQIWHRDLPQVDWMDINGAQGWTADSLRHLKFTVPALPEASPNAADRPRTTVSVTARFLRGWSQQRTYAVLQWYAWAEGGHAAPSRWFWADQWSQWRDRRRTPWVAVSLLMPIKPIGEIETARPDIEALGQLIQTTLMQGPLKSLPPG